MAGIQRAASPPLKDRRILVVEDDWFIADAVADLLAKEGADATVAEGEQLAKYWRRYARLRPAAGGGPNAGRRIF